jgi:predicted DNA-binding transcriptional regulator YafY
VTAWSRVRDAPSSAPYTNSALSSSTTLPLDGAATTRLVDPILLANTSQGWHLVGHCRLRDAVRWFQLDRVQSARLTAELAADFPVAAVGDPPSTARPIAEL